MADQNVNVDKLTDELLKPEKPAKEPQRNTKEWLIEKITEVADKNGLELTYSKSA